MYHDSCGSCDYLQEKRELYQPEHVVQAGMYGPTFTRFTSYCNKLNDEIIGPGKHPGCPYKGWSKKER